MLFGLSKGWCVVVYACIYPDRACSWLQNDQAYRSVAFALRNATAFVLPPLTQTLLTKPILCSSGVYIPLRLYSTAAVVAAVVAAVAAAAAAVRAQLLHLLL